MKRRDVLSMPGGGIWGETNMRLVRAGMLPFMAGMFVASALAQPAPAPPPVTRTVVAASKVPSVVDAPLYFRALQLVLPGRETSILSAPNGVLYQVSGSTEVTVAAETKTLHVGEGVFIAAGKMASLKAGNDASTMLHFLLSPDPNRNKPAVTVPLSLKELYRAETPIPDLKPGTYDLNLTRVTFPAHLATNPPHHRSGAALYYVLAGIGTNTIAGNTEPRAPGSFVYEPFGLVHQWGNDGDVPFVFLAFNINPDGVAAVVPGEPKGK
jgi:quercetin dioxygenase-like cupin family protein